MADKPDFIVDPSGNVQDVRHLKYSRQSASPPGQKPKAPPSKPRRSAPTTYPKRVQKSGQSSGIIFIPIGLILTIIFALSAASRPRNTPLPDATIPNLTWYSLKSGERHYSAGDYDLALASFNRVINSDLDPKIGATIGIAYHGRALVHLAMGKNDEAMADFNETIKLLPDLYLAFANRGGMYLAKAEYKSAINDFTRALLLWRASPAFYKNKEDGLTIYYDDVNVSSVYANRGRAYFSTGEFDLAIDDLEKALDIGLEPVDAVWVREIYDVLRLRE